jgi:hypothetical protein
VVGVLDGEGSMGEGGQGHSRARAWLVSLSFTEM